MAKKITIKKKKYKALISNTLKQTNTINAVNTQIGKMINNSVTMYCELIRLRQELSAVKADRDNTKTVLKTVQLENQQLVVELKRLDALNTELTVKLETCLSTLVKNPVEPNGPKYSAFFVKTDNPDKPLEIVITQIKQDAPAEPSKETTTDNVDKIGEFDLVATLVDPTPGLVSEPHFKITEASENTPSAMNSIATTKALAEITNVADKAWRDNPVTDNTDPSHILVDYVFAKKDPSVPTHPNGYPIYSVGPVDKQTPVAPNEINPDYSAGPGDDISFELPP